MDSRLNPKVKLYSQKGVIMKFTIPKTTKATPSCDLLFVGVFAGKPDTKKSTKKAKKEEPLLLESPLLNTLDKETKGHLLASAIKEGFLGKSGQCYCTSMLGYSEAKSVVLYGLGDDKDQEIDLFRRFGGDAYKIAHKRRAQSIALVIPPEANIALFDVVEASIEGIRLSSYKFDRYQTKNKDEVFVKDVQIILPKEPTSSLKNAVTRAEVLADAVCVTRDFINEGAIEVTPEYFAKEALTLGKKADLNVEVLDEKALKKENMNLLLAVASGSEKHRPPRVIRLHYKPKQNASKKVIALVGKGVTFDTGGLDIKTTEGMLDMKNDMAGAAAVLGTMLALAKLKPHVEVVGYLGCVENSVGPLSYHPGDIFRSRKGLTVEINNTDAEGRLVLADVMSYAQDRDQPDTMIDLATLTGACLVALGQKTAGLFSNDDNLVQSIIQAGKNVGESYWQLPLLSELKESLKSNIADMKNTGDRYGGSITAALFLQEFVENGVKWAHLDIAGPAINNKTHSYIPVGGAGFAVRTLVDFIMGLK